MAIGTLGLLLVAAYVAGKLLWDVSSGSPLSLGFGWAAAVLLLAVSALLSRHPANRDGATSSITALIKWSTNANIRTFL